MNKIKIHFNEQSFQDIDVCDDTLERFSNDLFVTLRALKKIRGITLFSEPPIFKITLGERNRTFSFLFSNDKDRIHFLKSLASNSPWYDPEIAYENDVYFENNRSISMTIAYNEASFILSLNSPSWDKASVEARNFIVTEDGDSSDKAVKICNIANSNHINHWQDELIDFGINQASSSIIGQVDGYVIRMWLNDHEPPHIHLQKRENPKFNYAKIRVDNFDIIEEKSKIKETRNTVIPWLKSNKDILLEGWKRCREGKHPIRID